MSQNESKAVIRFRITALKGKSYQDAHDFFAENIRPPDDVDVNQEGQIVYFYYDNNFNVIRHDDNWFLDVILDYATDEYLSFFMSADTLINTIDEYARKLNITEISDINIGAYTWYNVVDEPFEFK